MMTGDVSPVAMFFRNFALTFFTPFLHGPVFGCFFLRIWFASGLVLVDGAETKHCQVLWGFAKNKVMAEPNS